MNDFEFEIAVSGSPDYGLLVVAHFPDCETNKTIICKRVRTDADGEHYEHQFGTSKERMNPTHYSTLPNDPA